ncbi:hypothetical protein BC829DRAFT_378305, partial [Chytridium lagenaria]
MAKSKNHTKPQPEQEGPQERHQEAEDLQVPFPQGCRPQVHQEQRFAKRGTMTALKASGV